ncbi:uncharacterized protein BP5553_10595 [Venustampulla echinocandica]|uniref:Xylanolytic transcriptional activator regulatory domain-containing protein n=1 Tax=Venustampulla echinocandica TaxID=2656787 RepID=A0A370T908_9HELO|nr:uncharacterized protein BP5553_10595 [Venustampulla echinocandica]RDL29968.1 hypothetical protein BP5553_10595 [Venustampulla echinocandica]
MEVRFVPQQPERSSKRKQFNTACEICRRRKKRCVHSDSVPTRSPLDGYNPPVPQSSSPPVTGRDIHPDSDLLRHRPSTATRHGKTSPFHTPDRNPPDEVEMSSGRAGSTTNALAGDAPHAPFAVPKRFVGDLNPEALFLNSATANRGSPRSPHEIGVWLEGGGWDTVLREKEKQKGRDPPHPATIRPAFTNPGNDRASQCALDYSAYGFRHGLLASKLPDALVQAVFLAVSRDSLAKPHLQHYPGTSLVIGPREFSKAVYASILKGIRDGTQYDKVTLIRILALLSLHSAGPDGAEEASLHLAQAIHHAQTIGLHLGRGGHSKHYDSRKKLFWCLWSLDKLNAAINGRPVMISDHDLSIEPYSSSHGDSGFEIWLRLATMLRDMIGLYRPSAPDSATGWEDEFPGFEDIVEQYRGWSLSSSSLVTLHLFYLSVAILSSRSRSTNSTYCSTPSSVRQSPSATYVTTLICGTEPSDLSDILPLPLVPDGISLALAIAYRKLRQSRLPHLKRQAEQEFERCYWALEGLRHTWWSADIMATLARTVLREIHKSSNMSNRGSRSHPSLNAAGTRLEPSLPSPSSPAQMSQNRPGGHGHTEGQIRSPFEPRNQAANVNDGQQTNELDLLRQGGFGVQDPFDDIDHIFGTYLDPNFPVNYDDFLKIDDLGQFGLNNGRVHNVS